MEIHRMTKTFLSVAAIAAILVGIMVFCGGSSTSAEPRSYPMTCRGGGNLVIANAGNNGVRINFEPGVGAVYEGIKPGQCTWSDRKLRSGEPTTICDTDRKRASSYVGSLVLTKRTVIFQVYNDEQGCMKVTKVGP